MSTFRIHSLHWARQPNESPPSMAQSLHWHRLRPIPFPSRRTSSLMGGVEFLSAVENLFSRCLKWRSQRTARLQVCPALVPVLRAKGHLCRARSLVRSRLRGPKRGERINAVAINARTTMRRGTESWNRGLQGLKKRSSKIGVGLKFLQSPRLR